MPSRDFAMWWLWFPTFVRFRPACRVTTSWGPGRSSSVRRCSTSTSPSSRDSFASNSVVSAPSTTSSARLRLSGSPYQVSGPIERTRCGRWSTAGGTRTASLAIPTSVGMAAVAPHDERVLTVVGVVAAADAVAFEAQFLVKADRLPVRDAHLERVAAAVVFVRELEEPFEQARRDAAALVVGIDRDVHDVPGVDIPRIDDVADQLVALERAEADRRSLRELGGEHRARPRRPVGALLDLLDLGQVADRQAPDLDRERGHVAGFASG